MIPHKFPEQEKGSPVLVALWYMAESFMNGGWVEVYVSVQSEELAIVNNNNKKLALARTQNKIQLNVGWTVGNNQPNKQKN